MIACCWTVIHHSGTTELQTASSTMEASTAPSLSLGSCPVRSCAMPRVASTRPRNKASASFGRRRGMAAPRLMPAASGVSPITR